MKAALIKFVSQTASDNHTASGDYRIERIIEVNDEKSLNDIRRAFNYDYVIVVNNDVKENMIYDVDKNIIVNELGNQIYPPTTPDEQFVQMKRAIDELTFNVDINTLKLEELHDYLIKKSKNNLETYLFEHPMILNGKSYTVTSDKQAQLTGILNAYNYAKDIGIDLSLTWNETGKECKPYTYEKLVQLYLKILAYVKPLVSYQQSIEVKIRKTSSPEQALGIDISFKNYVPPIVSGA